MMHRSVAAAGLGLLAAHAASPAPAWAATTERVSVEHRPGVQADQESINDSPLGRTANLVAFNYLRDHARRPASRGHPSDVFLRDRAAGAAVPGRPTEHGRRAPADRASATTPCSRGTGAAFAFASFATEPRAEARRAASRPSLPARPYATGTTVIAQLHARTADGRAGARRSCPWRSRPTAASPPPRHRGHEHHRRPRAACTSSCATCRPADRPSTAGRGAAAPPTATPATRVDLRPAAASSPSAPTRPTSSPATPTARRTCSCATARPATIQRASVGRGRREGNAYSADGYDVRPRHHRRVHLRTPRTWSRATPTAWRTCSCATFQAGNDRARKRRDRRRAVERLHLRGRHVGRRALRGDGHGGHEPGLRRHQRSARHPRPRPRGRDDHARERQQRGRAGERLRRGAPISADGRVVSFNSDATNLVTKDTNGVRDVFVRVLGAGAR